MTLRPGLVVASVGVAVALLAGGCGSGARRVSAGAGARGGGSAVAGGSAVRGGSAVGDGSAVGSGPVGGGSAAAEGSGGGSAVSSRVFTDRRDGFAVAVPTSWEQLDLTASDVNANVAQLLADNPQLAAQVGSAQNLEQAGVRFLAVAPGGATDANVVVRPAPLLAGGRIDSLLSSLRSSVAAAGGTAVARPDLSVGDAPVLHVTVSISVGGRDVTTEQFYVVHAGRLYVLTVRAPAATVLAVFGSLVFSG